MATNANDKSPRKNFESRVLLFKPDTSALAQLAQGTSVVIATLLTIPDALGILPGMHSAAGWVLNLVGIWIIAAVLWFVGFTVILYMVGLAVRGVEISDEGIKLWRLAKVLKWDQIEAISVEPQLFFSTVFRLTTVARRLTIFERKKCRDGKFRQVPHYLPSFFFLPAPFEELCSAALERKFGFRPVSIDAFIADPGCLPRLQSTFGKLLWQRVGISLLIAVGLGCWLYKKGVSNFAYNSGNRAMDRLDYEDAERDYQWALQTDPVFAAASNQLGNAQFARGEMKKATTSWEKSIRLKPDYVEPRISLSFMALKQRDFAKAKELIDKALDLNPLNPYALLNRAELEMYQGQMHAAMEDARMVTVQQPDRNSALYAKATYLLAQSKVRLGDAESADKLLRALPVVRTNDRTQTELRLQVLAETAAAMNKADDAEKYFSDALTANPNNFQALCGRASISLSRHRLEQAERRIDQASKVSPDSVTISLLKARLQLERGDISSATRTVTGALTTTTLDGNSLVEAGNICLELHQLDQAALCAQRALRIDRDDVAAKKLLACIAAERTKYDARTQ